jgi:hypothetical protein
MMPAKVLRKNRLVIATVCLIILAWCLIGNLRWSQAEVQARPAEESAQNDKGKYLGANYCAQCHEEKGKRSDEYVLLTEYATWKTKDKHAQAYQKLTEPRAKQMGMLLNIKDVTKEDRCLNCHAANVPKELRVEEGEQAFKIEDGVSCDACHGPSSNWIVPHSLVTWRTTPMQKKEALGMRDVRDPIKRSNLCLSCHIGNAAEKKVVTHEMYAAGHPPLPSFEVATFSDEMPRHWRYHKEKKPAIQTLLKVDPTEHERTKLSVIGNVMTLQRTVNLLAGAAGAGSSVDWPELAQFDCYACHHELKTSSWRQEAGYPGRPGRPHLRTWPTKLISLGIQDLDKEGAKQRGQQYRDRLGKLYRVFDAQPFGKAQEVVPAARDLAEWANEFVKQLSAGKYDQKAGEHLLRELCQLSRGEVLDYDSARQMSWTLRVIYNELDPKPANDAKIQEILKKLDKQLKLTLPSGTGQEIMKELKHFLQRMNDYDPGIVRQLYQQLGEEVSFFTPQKTTLLRPSLGIRAQDLRPVGGKVGRAGEVGSTPEVKVSAWVATGRLAARLIFCGP